MGNCLDCGRRIKDGRLDPYCSTCTWNHGVIYILDMRTWKWEVIDLDAEDSS